MDTYGHADPGRKLRHGVSNGERGPNGAFGVIAMCDRRAEDCHGAVTDVLVDPPPVIFNDAIHALEKPAQQGVDLLCIVLIAKCCEIREIREEHCYLTAFAQGMGRRRADCLRRQVRSRQGGDGIKQLAAVADQSHAEILEVLGCQLRQNCRVDCVISEGLLVTGEAETTQPCRNVQRHPPSSKRAAFAGHKAYPKLPGNGSCSVVWRSG